MATAKNWKPDHVSTVTPYLIIKDCAKAVDFYKKAFGAEEMHRLCAPDGKIMHSCVKLGDSAIFLCDEMDDPSCGSSPSTLKGCHATMHVFVEDVDKAFQKAVDAGCTVKLPPTDMFWGDRYTAVTDPFGQGWSLATHKEELTPDEMQKRGNEFFKNMQACAAKA